MRLQQETFISKYYQGWGVKLLWDDPHSFKLLEDDSWQVLDHCTSITLRLGKIYFKIMLIMEVTPYIQKKDN